MNTVLPAPERPVTPSRTVGLIRPAPNSPNARAVRRISSAMSVRVGTGCHIRADGPLHQQGMILKTRNAVPSPFDPLQTWSAASRKDHCALMPANFTTLPHFSISSAISLANSAGDPTSGVAPISESRALIPGSASAALNSLLSLSTTSMGVFMGAPIPNQLVTSKPGTKSPTGGRTGSASSRVAVVTASAVVDKLNKEFNAALADPGIKARLSD